VDLPAEAQNMPLAVHAPAEPVIVDEDTSDDENAQELPRTTAAMRYFRAMKKLDGFFDLEAQEYLKFGK
jgi:hypothetical protein